MATLTDPPQLWDAIFQLCCSPKPFCCFPASWEAPHKLVTPSPHIPGVAGVTFCEVKLQDAQGSIPLAQTSRKAPRCDRLRVTVKAGLGLSRRDGNIKCKGK